MEKCRSSVVTFALLLGSSGLFPGCGSEAEDTGEGGPVEAPAVDDGLKPQSPCSAQQTCYGGTTIACSGTYCSAGPGLCGGWVSCDGVRRDCPEIVEYAHPVVQNQCCDWNHALVQPMQRTCGGWWEEAGGPYCTEYYCAIE